jgi:ribosome-binding protein aMBF1 (putative translation factor)
VGAIGLTSSRAGVYSLGVSKSTRPRLEGPTHGRIRRLRAALGLTQVELAARLGVHKTLVSQWELGKGLPANEHREALAKALDTTVGKLMAGEKSWALMRRLTGAA